MAERSTEVSDILNAAALLLGAIVGDNSGHVSQQTREQVVRQAIALRAEVEKTTRRPRLRAS